MRTRKSIVLCVDDGTPTIARYLRDETDGERAMRGVRELREGDKAKRVADELPMRVFHCLPIPGELKALVKALDKFGVGWEASGMMKDGEDWIPRFSEDATVAFRVWGHAEALERIGRLRFVRVRDDAGRLNPRALPEECPGGNRPAVARMREKRTIRIS